MNYPESITKEWFFKYRNKDNADKATQQAKDILKNNKTLKQTREGMISLIDTIGICLLMSSESYPRETSTPPLHPNSSVVMKYCFKDGALISEQINVNKEDNEHTK